MSTIAPTTNGTYLFPEALDFNLKHNTNKPFYTFANRGSAALTTITHLEFSRACHRVAHALRPDCESLEGRVVAVIAMADTIVLQATIAGLILAGLVPFPISPRNSPAAIVNLLQKTDCHRIITTEVTLQSLVDDITVHLAATYPAYALTIDELPSLEQVYPRLGTETFADPFLPFPPPARRPTLHDLCLYIHSSGSTGFPKAIPHTHRVVLQLASWPFITDLCNPVSPCVLAAMFYPPYHSIAFTAQLLCPIFGIVSLSVFPPVVTSKDSLPMVPSPDNVLDHMIRTNSTCVYVVPFLLQSWSTSSKAVNYLRTLTFVGFGGGVLAKKIGDELVAAGIRLRMIYGGTEFGLPTQVPSLEGDEKDWDYIKFSDSIKLRWNPQGDETFEGATDSYELSIENLPDVRGYATSDIFQRHPTKPHLWKIVGRMDDVIVHSLAEKTVPGPMEEIIMGSKVVQGAVMFGRGRSMAGVLVELTPSYRIDVNDTKKVAELRHELLPVIEEANRDALAFSRIFKEMILFTSPDKVLPRTGKDTVMRKAAIQLYDSEITALYNSIEESGAKGIQPPKEWSVHHIEKWLLEQASDIHAGKVFDPTVDLFEQGFDSLSATLLRHRIISVLRIGSYRSDVETISQNTVYSYPMISTLSLFLAGLFSHAEGQRMVQDRRSEMERMIERYSVGLDTMMNTGSDGYQTVDTPAVVLLTGSTGNLGADLLVSFLEHPRVGRVYALNRPSSTATMAERHRDKFVDKGFSESMLGSDKLVFVEGDTSEPNLGVRRRRYIRAQSWPLG